MEKQLLANYFIRTIEASLDIDKSKCQMIKNGLMRKSGELFEFLDHRMKGFITENDLWQFSQEMRLSFSKDQISFIFDCLDLSGTHKLGYKDFLDSLEPVFLLTDELAILLAHGYDHPSMSGEFTTATKLDFCVYIKSLFDNQIVMLAVRKQLLDSHKSTLDYYRMLDTNCRCKLDIHDLIVFLEPFIEFGIH